MKYSFLLVIQLSIFAQGADYSNSGSDEKKNKKEKGK
jgi:hypothetical protein